MTTFPALSLVKEWLSLRWVSRSAQLLSGIARKPSVTIFTHIVQDIQTVRADF